MKITLRILFFLLFLQNDYVPIYAQSGDTADKFDITAQSMQFPHPSHKWKFQVSAGLSMVKPPKDLLENAIQAPLVNIHSTFSLPWKLSLEGDLTTIVVSNQFALGPRINFLFRNFGIKGGCDFAFIYGQLKQGEFNNSTTSWMYYPNLSVGYKLKKIAFTLKEEAVIVSKVSTKSGENQVTDSRNFFNGVTTAVYIEQRIHKNKVFVIGLKDNYLKMYWPTWMLFSTFNRFYHIPELYFSWII